MQKQIFRKRNFVSTFLSLTFLIVAITGVIIFITPYSIRMSEIHIIFGFLFVGFAGFHLVLNFKQLLAYLKKKTIHKVKNHELILSMALTTIIFLATIGNVVPPISTFMDLRKQIQAIQQKESNKTEVITHSEKIGRSIKVSFYKGKNYTHTVRRPFKNTILIPQIAVWIETLDGHFVDTLYVTQRSGKSDWWSMPLAKEPVRRKASLPVWSHRRGIESENGYFMPSENEPIADAITSATPVGSFYLRTKINKNLTDFRIFVELNKSWDYNKYYTPDRIGEDVTLSHARRSFSGQPAVVYSGVMHVGNTPETYVLSLTGHSDPRGENGKIYSDTSRLDTALEIIDLITVEF